jgi:hypothetical protein
MDRPDLRITDRYAPSSKDGPSELHEAFFRGMEGSKGLRLDCAREHSSEERPGRSALAPAEQDRLEQTLPVAIGDD